MVAAAAIFVANVAAAQDATVSHAVTGGRTWPLELGVVADSIGFMPGTPHPLLSIGTEFPYDNRGLFRMAQAVAIEYRLQPNFLHGPVVSTRFIARWMSSLGVFGEVGLGGGVMVAWLAQRTWRYDPTSRALVEGGNDARVIYRVSLGLGVGLDLSVRLDLPVRVIAGYDEMLLLNVMPEAGVPILPAGVWGIRLAWFLGGPR